MDAVGIGDVVADKPAAFHQLQRFASIGFKTEFVFIPGFRQMGVQAHAVLACQFDRLIH